MCVYIDGMLFSGDTIMPTKPYFNGRDSSEDEWHESVNKVLSHYTPDTLVYPGHENPLTLTDWVEQHYRSN